MYRNKNLLSFIYMRTHMYTWTNIYVHPYANIYTHTYIHTYVGVTTIIKGYQLEREEAWEGFKGR